ncbi:hypothetical protein BDL97_01G197600 [Sphagnum fallax]|nr:hypothetical protein BDL97_01G197600 [Sphagnum fallax]KAH8976118.1 hypothetical protein BDL97_01G197600 [Sphagnum fallax]
MERTTTMFQPDTVHEIFKLVWGQLASKERAKDDLDDTPEGEVVAAAGATKKLRSTSANANALKLSCELLRLFVCAVQRVSIIAEGEGLSTIEGTHLERILPQLLLDF